MIQDITNIFKDVRTIIDENATASALIELADVETLDLDNLITSVIEQAVETVETAAPIHRLESEHVISGNIKWNDNNAGEIDLPADYMRLLTMKMSDWTIPVYKVLTPDDADYALQHSKHKGIRGTWQRPRVAVVPTVGGRKLEFFSCKNQEATIESALYLPKPKITNEQIEICKDCYRSIVYQCAGLVMLAYKDQAAQSMFDISTALMQ